jgi:signal transduction histidine kinase
VYINYAVLYAIKAGNKKRLALAYLNRADVYTNLQNYKAAIADCDTAMNYALEVNSNEGIGRIYSIMSGVYRSMKDYPKALAILDESEKFMAKVNNRQMIALNYSERADILLETNKPLEAIPILRKAIFIADSLNDIENLSAYYSELAQAFLDLKKYKDAIVYAKKGLGYSEQTNNTAQQAVIYEVLYQIEAAQNNYERAIEYALKAYTLIKPETDLLREKYITSSLAEAYHKIGNTDEAYTYLKISSKLNDSLIKRNFTEETARLQTEFEVKQKDREIQLLNKDKELQQQKLTRQRLLFIGALLLFALTLASVWLLMNRNKLRQRMNELELRNQIAADLHDEVGSSLSSIHMLSQMASSVTASVARKNILERVSINAKETMERMGDIVWMIKPGETDGGSLKQRIERFACEISESKNIELYIDLHDLDKLNFTMQFKKNIYLICKEAVNNAAKYSETKKIELSSNLKSNQLSLSIKDFGKGFNVDDAKKGNGIDNMRNRAIELKASLTIESKEETGTVVQMTIPV